MSIFGGRKRAGREAEGPLHPAIAEFLLTGRVPPEAPDSAADIPFEPTRAERLWRVHRAVLLAEARRRHCSPFAMTLFEGKDLPGLPSWGWHSADPRPLLSDRPVRPCPRCGSTDLRLPSCLGRVPTRGDA